ncbi:MAG TPA: hypothetical protein VF621_08070, partial [Pyrinomonadaceae bacterium]
MNLRTKLIVVFAALALLPLAFACLLQYRAGAGAVESLLRERASERASRMARDVGHVLDVEESRLLELAREDAVRRYALEQSPRPAGADEPTPPGGSANPSVREAAAAPIEGPFETYVKHNGGYVQSVTFLDANRQPVFRLYRPDGGGQFVRQTSDFVNSHARHEQGVWAARTAAPLRSPLSEEQYGTALRVTVPVFDPAAAETGGTPAGALVAEVGLGQVVKAGETSEGEGAPAGPPRRPVVALDNGRDTVVYHTNGALTHRPASDAMAYFKEVAAQMRAGGSGSAFYDTAEGETQLAAFQQVKGLNLSVAAA